MLHTRYSRPARATGLRLLCAAVIFGFGCNVALGQSAGSNEGGSVPQPVPEFPANNWWNTDISKAPVDPKSASYIGFVNSGGSRHLHPDFGGNASYGGAYAIYGFPYVVVDGVTGSGKSPPPLQTVQFNYADESDGVNHSTGTPFPFYPIPPQATTTPRWVECGAPATVDQRNDCDRHLLVIDRDHKYLYELWNVWYDATHKQWYAGSGAFFDMTKNGRRPDGWTSADAAGLAIFPGLVRYDEVYNAYGTNVSQIGHAFRVTVRSTNGYVYPASHNAGSTAGALPMGARLRLKASVNISSYPAQMQKIFNAMKTYGLIVADNGSDMYISGTYDTHWNNDVLNPAFGGLTASDFEVIQLGWQPPLSSLTVSPGRVVGGQNATATVTLLQKAPTSGASVALSGTAGLLKVPATVTVPAGATSASFTVGTVAVTTPQAPTINASYNGAVSHVGLSLIPPMALTSITVNPGTIASGKTATGSVVLNEAAAAPVKVTLTSSNTAIATVPANVTVPVNAKSVNFTVQAGKVTAKQAVTISAIYAGVTKTVVVYVTP
ncbi:MAG: hypothetical protein JSR34_01320 [Proteobacteria bacterium]|nr:hypothetical protein [Pseudomonadota bacterium]